MPIMRKQKKKGTGLTAELYYRELIRICLPWLPWEKALTNWR